MTRLAGPIARKRRRQQRGMCFLCGSSLGGDESPDHLIPISKGGALGWRNKVIVHRKCNFAKWDQMPTTEQLERFESTAGHRPEVRDWQRAGMAFEPSRVK